MPCSTWAYRLKVPDIKTGAHVDVLQEIQAPLNPIRSKYIARGWRHITIKHASWDQKARVVLHAISPRGTRVEEIFEEDEQLADNLDSFLALF